jgi:hypothetical protein
VKDDVLRKLLESQQADQGEAGMAHTARLCGTFYRELIGQNVPSSLARLLVRDWFCLLYSKVLWPDTPPRMPGGDE